MSVVKKLADRVAVIEGGRIVEQGTTYEIFSNPRHDTTRKFVGTVTGGNVPDWLLAKITPNTGRGRAPFCASPLPAAGPTIRSCRAHRAITAST